MEGSHPSKGVIDGGGPTSPTWKTLVRRFAPRTRPTALDVSARKLYGSRAAPTMPSCGATALVCVGIRLQAAGRTLDAAKVVDEARRLWKRKGSDVSAEQLRRCLDQLALGSFVPQNAH